jgi:hypothetical protein
MISYADFLILKTLHWVSLHIVQALGANSEDVLQIRR